MISNKLDAEMLHMLIRSVETFIDKGKKYFLLASDNKKTGTKSDMTHKLFQFAYAKQSKVERINQRF